MDKRKLFCEISPFTYKISVLKCVLVRHLRNFFGSTKFAKLKSEIELENLVYSHKSLIMRTLGNVDLTLQQNKFVNLTLSSPKVDGVLIKSGEIFSFWSLVGSLTKSKGYKEGLVIVGDKTDKGIGGGMCQFTNLIHYLILHSPLDITEHHHHNGFDLFPDFKRQVPFGVGTSVMYNYLDYRFKNNTDYDFQIKVSIEDKYLCGKLLCSSKMDTKYHVYVENESFEKLEGVFYRNNIVKRKCINKKTGDIIEDVVLTTNHAKVMYEM